MVRGADARSKLHMCVMLSELQATKRPHPVTLVLPCGQTARMTDGRMLLEDRRCPSPVQLLALTNMGNIGDTGYIWIYIYISLSLSRGYLGVMVRGYK